MRAIFLLLAFLVTSACFHKTSGPDHQFDGNYLAYDHAENLILQGNLNFTVNKDSTVTGNWVIDWISGANTSLEVGPQVGSGKLRGHIANGWLNLDLNPDMADNNVNLYAIWSETVMNGTWYWVTFAGPTTTGTFSIEIGELQ